MINNHIPTVTTHARIQRCTTFLGQGPQRTIFSALEGRRKKLLAELSGVECKKPNCCFYFTSLFIASGLILLISELFRIVISCKIVNSSIKFKFIRKISVNQEKFLVFLTCSEAG